MRRIKFTENRFWLALLIAAIAFGGIVTYVQAFSFARVADSAGQGGITNGSYNRAVACREDECYAFGGGGGASVSTQLFRYLPSTNTWSMVSSSSVGGGAVSERAYGANESYMAMLSYSAGGTPGSCFLQIVNLDTYAWSNAGFPTNPELATRCSGGSAGTVAGNYFYFTAVGGGEIFFFRINLLNPTSFETLMDWPQTCSGGGNNIDGILVWDENVNELVLFHTADGCISTYDLDTGIWTDRGMIFDPCISAGYCVPTVGFFDIDNGVSAGVFDSGSDTIALYAYSPDTMTFVATENLTDADLDYDPINGADGCCIRAGWWVDVNMSKVLMGSSTATAGGVSANRWWSITGDQVPFDPTERDFNSWLNNFLSSMGMNSPVGRLLVGSLFAGVLFFVLALKGVPWVMSLGITGFAVVTMTAAMIFDPAILLGLIAIAGVASIGLIFSLFIGGGDRGG